MTIIESTNYAGFYLGGPIYLTGPAKETKLAQIIDKKVSQY